MQQARSQTPEVMIHSIDHYVIGKYNTNTIIRMRLMCAQECESENTIVNMRDFSIRALNDT